MSRSLTECVATDEPKWIVPRSNFTVYQLYLGLRQQPFKGHSLLLARGLGT